MKTEQALRKTPAEPVAVMPETQLTGYPAQPQVQRTEVFRQARPRTGAAVYSDIPPSVYGSLILTWAALMSVFWMTFAESPNAAWMVTISTAFAIMFFGVPIVLNRLGYRQPWSGPGLGDFLRGNVQTLTGPVNGVDALVQVIVVPACLTIGAAFISLIIDLDRMAF